MLEFFLPGIEVLYGMAGKQGRFELAQQGADLVRIGARVNFDDVLCQFRHGQVCRQSEAAVDQEAQYLAPVIRILFFIGAANTEPQTCGTGQALCNSTAQTSTASRCRCSGRLALCSHCQSQRPEYRRPGARRSQNRPSRKAIASKANHINKGPGVLPASRPPAGASSPGPGPRS